MAMQEGMQVGVEDGGYTTFLGGAQSGENLGNEKRGSLVSMMSEKCEHTMQKVCQIQIQIQNSTKDRIGIRKIGEKIQGEKGKENKSKYMAGP